MTDTLQGWADRAASLPAALVFATPAAVHAGGQVLQQAAHANLLAASGGDGVLSRVRSGKGARVDVQVKVRGAGSNAESVVTPVGPVSLLEKDTSAHRQPFSYGTGRKYAMAGEQLSGGRGKARRKKAKRSGFIYVPGLGIFQNVRHPGTKGQRPVGKAFDTHHDEAGRSGVAVLQEAVEQHFR